MIREDNHPDFLLCPVTLAIFREPVTVAPSGKVYEWEAIDRIITDAKSQGKPPLCPATKMPVTGYVKAFNIVAAVEYYLQAHPDAKADQYTKLKAEHVPNDAVRVSDDGQAAAAPVLSVDHAISADDRLAIEAAQAELNATPPRRDINRQVQDMVARAEALHDVEREPRDEEVNRNNLRMFLLESIRASGASESLVNSLMRAPEPNPAREVMQAGGMNQPFFAAGRQNQMNAAALERLERDSREADRRQAVEAARQHELAIQRENEHIAQLRRENDALERQRLERERELARAQENHGVKLHGEDELKRDRLILKIQDLIFALDFELGPSFGLRLEWKKIQVKDGPKNVEAMYNVLKAAIRALKELNPDVLNAEREKYKGKYDCVNTMFGGQKSLGDGGYANFAWRMGTINNQPGFLIHQILECVDNLLNKLILNHPAQVQHVRVVRP